MQANTLETPAVRPALREPVCWQLTLNASYEVSIEFVLTCTASSESVASLFLMLQTIKCQLKLHNDRYLLPRYAHVYSICDISRHCLRPTAPVRWMDLVDVSSGRPFMLEPSKRRYLPIYQTAILEANYDAAKTCSTSGEMGFI